MAQLTECWPNMHKNLGWIPSMAYIRCGGDEESEVQGNPWQHNHFETTLDTGDLASRKRKKREYKQKKKQFSIYLLESHF